MQPASNRSAIDTAKFVAIVIALNLAIGVTAWLLLADMYRLANAPL